MVNIAEKHDNGTKGISSLLVLKVLHCYLSKKKKKVLRS